RPRLGVVRGALVRVLAVRQVALLPEGGDQALRERLPVREPLRDRRLVRGRDDERLARERAPRLQGELAVVAELGEHRAVPFGTGERADVREGLRRRAE